MSRYGARAVELLKEFRRSEANFLIGPYNEDAVRRIVQEVDELYAECLRISEAMKRTPEEIPALTSALTVHHSAMQRNKRCLLAYLQARVLQIEQVRWDFGQAPPASVRDSYSPFEQQYMSQYNQILQTYMGSVQCTLTEDLNPPKDLLAEVRCLTNEGEIVTENGTIVLRKNSTLFLRRSDVDMLIRQGLVEHVHSTDR